MSGVPLPAAGEAVAGRFELERVAGVGGMGTVWRARDRESGEIVALKLTLGRAEEEVGWIEREAVVLSRIDHPSVVRYLDHGVTGDGTHYLAMEWLEGEDLAARLERGPLALEHGLQLAGQVAETLAAVHARGIVHRDLKPSNLFLVGGDLARPKLTDFGIAHVAGDPAGAAHSGITGTPFYMAPEQARGEHDVDARADLYALGSVLFECLTGRPPFLAANPVAVLTKVLFEEAPMASQIRAGIPAAVDRFLAAMLAKDAARRPADAAAIAQKVDALRRGSWGPPPSSRSLALALTRNERRLLSVVLATEAKPEPNGRDMLRVTADAGAPAPERSNTISLPRSAAPLPELQGLAARYGVALEVLRDGSVAAVLSGSGAPTDLAARAARCALSLRELVPDARVALVTGWDVFTGTQPLGQVIDRAAELLETRAQGSPREVILDPMTAALLGGRFAISGDERAPALSGEREPEVADAPRRLLGKPTACVGRSRELGALEDLFEESATERVARVAIVTAAPGVGKSRLRDELVRRLRARDGAELEIWSAQGDPMRQNAPFGMLGQIVRRAAWLLDHEPLEVRRQRLAARVARRVDGAVERRVTEFLGEVVGTPFPADDSVQLRAARQEPMLMGDQMRRAWVDLLEAECRAHPVVIVLDDLQWGDQPTVDFVDTALRLLPRQPLLVLALARPSVHRTFPGLWSGRARMELELGPLPPEACADLVRQALGEEIPAEEVARLVERSAGNAFFLEELVRAFAEGRADDVPETVLAMMQSRLESLEPEARRIVRAGSLLGEVFWRGAVTSLLGLPPHAPRLDRRLAELERGEWITRRLTSRFRGEAEYVFRHGLIREAAHGMLTDEDAALGHRLAGEWLEAAGETDAMALAQHFDRGGEHPRAAGWYRLAAQQALEGNDLAATVARTERAISCGVSGPLLGELCLIRAEAHRWMGSYADAHLSAQVALEVFPGDTESWFAALREALASRVDTEGQEEILAMADLLYERWSDPEAVSGAQVIATAWMTIRLFALALRDRAEAFHAKLAAVEDRFADHAAVLAHLAMERAFREGYLVLDMGSFGAALEVALARFEQVGDTRSACHMRVNLGHALNELGAYRENVELLTALRADAERLGLPIIEVTAQSHLGKALMALGQLDEAERAERAAADAFALYGDQRMEGGARACLALILERAGELARAEAEARRAAALLEHLPALQVLALAVLSRVLIASARIPEALDAARRAVASADEAEEGEILIRLVHAEALEASGDHTAARRAIAVARARLLERARTIANSARRDSFLESVPENARVLALAEAWLDDPPGAPP